MSELRGTSVYVGLSGGVDSAVAAALLQRAGARVTGVFIKGWYPPGMPCSWRADRRDALRVAARLGIPFRTLDASTEYRREVIEYLLAEYRAGRTPNPDVMCNREVKFGAFYRYARAHGADALATGHYRSGTKDQSYFLWAVPADALAFTVFPLRGKEKNEVRALARRYRLPVAEKKDSQGVCFLGDVSVHDFLQSEFATEPGRALDALGQVIGTHDGALLYTLGERVALRNAEAGPWFVVAKDIEKNEIEVAHTPKRGDMRFSEGISFSHENWHTNVADVSAAQLRYRGAYVPGRVRDRRFYPQQVLPELPTPGQSIVFYAGGELAGGGIIEP